MRQQARHRRGPWRFNASILGALGWCVLVKRPALVPTNVMRPTSAAGRLAVAPRRARETGLFTSVDGEALKDQQQRDSTYISDAVQLLLGYGSEESEDSGSKSWPVLIQYLRTLAMQGRADAEVVLVSVLRSPDAKATTLASQALRTMWAKWPASEVSVQLAQAGQMQKLKRASAAIDIYSKLIADYPEWVGAYQERAKCYVQMGDREKSIDDLRRALQLSPVNYQVMVELGLVLTQDGHHEEALDSFESARAIFPAMPTLNLFMQELLNKMPDSAKSLESVDNSSDDMTDLMPSTWLVDNDRTTDQQGSSGVFVEWGVSLLRRVGASGQDGKATLRQRLTALKSAWEAQNHGAAFEKTASQTSTLLDTILQAFRQGDDDLLSAEEVEKYWARAKARFVQSGGALPDLDTGALASAFAEKGYVHIPHVGIDPEILSMVQDELPVLDTDSTRDAGRYDINCLFFDADPSEVRKDIPAMHELDTVLNKVCERLAVEVFNMTLGGKEDAMVAAYSPNAFYYRHTDNKAGIGRCLTAIYYLNRNWDPEMGGQLRIYPGTAATVSAQTTLEDIPHVDFYPHEDSLVLFPADTMLHEVRRHNADGRKRYAMTLWFRGKIAR